MQSLSEMIGVPLPPGRQLAPRPDVTPSEYYGLTKEEYDELQTLCARFGLYGGPCTWVALTSAKPGEMFLVEQKIIQNPEKIVGYRYIMMNSLLMLRDRAKREDATIIPS